MLFYFFLPPTIRCSIFNLEILYSNKLNGFCTPFHSVGNSQTNISYEIHKVNCDEQKIHFQMNMISTRKMIKQYLKWSSLLVRMVIGIERQMTCIFERRFFSLVFWGEIKNPSTSICIEPIYSVCRVHWKLH